MRRRGLDVHVDFPVTSGLGLGIMILGITATTTSVIAGIALMYVGAPPPCMAGMCMGLGPTFVPGYTLFAIGFPIGFVATVGGAVMRGEASPSLTLTPRPRPPLISMRPIGVSGTPLAGGGLVNAAFAF